jgi:hypothetical protein
VTIPGKTLLLPEFSTNGPSSRTKTAGVGDNTQALGCFAIRRKPVIGQFRATAHFKSVVILGLHRFVILV